jgi:hypothetical protein
VEQRLVTIARFPDPVSAELARGQLDARGIPVLLDNEMGGQQLGGVISLRVPKEHAAEARSLLEAGFDEEPGGAQPQPAGPAEPDTASPWTWGAQTEPEVRCLVCQSSLVEVADFPLLVRILREIVLRLLPLPPAWLESRRRRCGVCHFEWTHRTGEAPDRPPPFS